MPGVTWNRSAGSGYVSVGPPFVAVVLFTERRNRALQPAIPPIQPAEESVRGGIGVEREVLVPVAAAGVPNAPSSEQSRLEKRRERTMGGRSFPVEERRDGVNGHRSRLPIHETEDVPVAGGEFVQLFGKRVTGNAARVGSDGDGVHVPRHLVAVAVDTVRELCLPL